MRNELIRASRSTLKTCMNLKKGESLLIIYDRNSPLRVVNALFQEAERIGTEAISLEIIPRQLNGEEPPEAVAETMKEVDVILAPTSKSLSHTNARRVATNVGVRIATLPGVTEEIFIRGMQADYEKIKKRGDKLLPLLNQASEAHLTSPQGTDLKITLGNKFMNDHGLYGNSGDFGNLPAGEVCGAPVEEQTNGTLVIDHMGTTITQPTRLDIKDGKVINIQENDSGKRLREQLEDARKKDGNDNAFMVAELGIGTNDSAKLSGNVLEDEKVYETIHVAVGDNTSYDGGTSPSCIHLDGIILEPTLTVDGEKIIERGKHHF